jgi:secondary thiamine-phosphate synthase enzyme
MLKEFQISTNKNQELIDITSQVKRAVKDSQVKEGICLVYVAHATAGILINENYDKGVCEDIITQLEKIVPIKANYKHNCVDNNAHSHIKAALIGPGETIIIKDAEPLLGTWQGIALAEFDGPRKRRVFVKIIKG